MTATNQQLLETRHLKKHFGGVVAVKGVSLSIRKGEIRGVIGPNGAGKTCLLNLLSGLYAPTSGSIVYGGVEITRRAARTRPELGIARTFQVAQICPEMTALQNILLGFYPRMEQGGFAAIFRAAALRRHSAELEDRGRQLLQLVELRQWEQISAGQLPYGKRKILEIGRALAGDPKLLLLDEPTAGLNPNEVAKLKDYIAEANRRGAAVLVVEHNMRLVMDICERITVLRSGAVIAEGSAAEIQSDRGVIEAYLGRRWRGA